MDFHLSVRKLHPISTNRSCTPNSPHDRANINLNLLRKYSQKLLNYTLHMEYSPLNNKNILGFYSEHQCLADKAKLT